MTIVAIHQPNYAPWLGYFSKIARCDAFVFLDDVQYSKNSYTNRAQIDAGGSAKWLTVSVGYKFGALINQVSIADRDWRTAHLRTLANCYAQAPHYREVSHWLERTFANLPQQNLAASNRALVQSICGQLGVTRTFYDSSEFSAAHLKGDDRLIFIVNKVQAGAGYLSGKGGANYQDPHKFEKSGIRLVYNDFVHPVYERPHADFISGLSVFDALYHLGFEKTAKLIKASTRNPS